LLDNVKFVEPRKSNLHCYAGGLAIIPSPICEIMMDKPGLA
jgi:hypothetical protein